MTPSTNNGGPAFPTVTDRASDYSANEWGQSGMSLRDWFAGQVMAELSRQLHTNGHFAPHDVAIRAYATADAMLAARDGKESA